MKKGGRERAQLFWNSDEWQKFFTNYELPLETTSLEDEMDLCTRFGEAFAASEAALARREAIEECAKLAYTFKDYDKSNTAYAIGDAILKLDERNREEKG